LKVLIVRGGWSGHEPVATTELMRPFFQEHGFEVRVAETLAVYADPAALAAADLIVQCWTRGRLTEEQETGLVDRVAAGAGFAGWHGGVVATAYDARRYHFMIGGRFVCHPGGFVDHRIDVTAEHPITTGVDSFDVRTEQYYCHVDPGLQVLATTTFAGLYDAPETAGVVMPVVWTRHFGAGRVFVNTLGHGPDDLRMPATRTLTERGLLWAAGLL
jgi:type 1 glutamine amidotransferase